MVFTTVANLTSSLPHPSTIICLSPESGSQKDRDKGSCQVGGIVGSPVQIEYPRSWERIKERKRWSVGEKGEEAREMVPGDSREPAQPTEQVTIWPKKAQGKNSELIYWWTPLLKEHISYWLYSPLKKTRYLSEAQLAQALGKFNLQGVPDIKHELKCCSA